MYLPMLDSFVENVIENFQSYKERSAIECQKIDFDINLGIVQ